MGMPTPRPMYKPMSELLSLSLPPLLVTGAAVGDGTGALVGDGTGAWVGAGLGLRVRSTVEVESTLVEANVLLDAAL